MSEIGKILALWRSLADAATGPVLATVVRVDGSSYRKPGARMLIAPDGRRAGTISGGCLESEVARKAAWHSANGASVQQYSSFFDEESGIPYGLGCGGIVHVMFERGAAVDAVLNAISRGFDERVGSTALAVIASDSDRLKVGTYAVIKEQAHSVTALNHETISPQLLAFAHEASRQMSSLLRSFEIEKKRVEVFAEYLAPAPAVLIFGAGDDAQPLVEFTEALGWRVTVVDGRAQLATRDRFPRASSVCVMNTQDPLAAIKIMSSDAAVVMTHSYEQDRGILGQLLQHDLAYLGVLGPRKRTIRLVNDLSAEIGLTPAECIQRLRSPVGLDIGAREPAGIALAIAAEMHAALHARDAVPLTRKPFHDADSSLMPNYSSSHA